MSLNPGVGWVGEKEARLTGLVSLQSGRLISAVLLLCMDAGPLSLPPPLVRLKMKIILSLGGFGLFERKMLEK